MDPAVEEVTPLASHLFLDAFALAYHRAVTERLRIDPNTIIQHARENLARWIGQGEMSAPAIRSLQEWQRILEQSSVEQIIKIITADSDESQRLRQSTPFAGILSPKERRDLLTICEERASSQSGSSGE